MKFSKVSQLGLVSVLGIALACVLSGCQLVSIDYVFVADSAGNTAGSAGQIETFAADAASGALRVIGTATSSGGTSPVALATTPDYANLYAANQGNNSLVHFAINGDGTLTNKDSVTVPFTPNAIAVNQAGTYLYVVGGTSPASIAVYPLSSGKIGALASSTNLTLSGYASDTIVPTAIDVLASNGEVYVAAWDQSAYNPGGSVTSSANPGWVYGFTVGTNGSLAATTGSPYQAGVKPAGITSDPTNRFVYVTDYASNELIAYNIQSSGELNFLVNGPFKTGNQPVGVVVDPRGIFLYVTNSLSNTISGFSIALPTGTPTTVVSSSGVGALPTDTDPVALLVDPALGRYVYTADYLGNSISGFRLDPNSGTLTATQGMPYPTGAHPTAIAAVPNGNHAVETVAP